MKAALAALSFVLAVGSGARAEQIRLAADGEWSAFSDGAGERHGCGVQAAADNRGLTLSGASDHPGTLRLSYYTSGWQLPGGTVPVLLRFDGGVSFRLQATGTQSLVRADVPATDLQSFVRHFTTDSNVEVSLPDRLEQAAWNLDLNGTVSTVNAMSQCLQQANIWLPPPFTQPQPEAAPAPARQPSEQSWIDPGSVSGRLQKTISAVPASWSNRLAFAKPAARPAEDGRALAAKILQDVAVFNVAANCGMLRPDQANSVTSMLTTELGVVDAKYGLQTDGGSPVKTVQGVVQAMRNAYSVSRCSKIRANPGEAGEVNRLFKVVYNSAGGAY